MIRTIEPSSRRPDPHEPPRRSTWRERVFVLGGLALAVPATAVSLAIGMDGGAIGFIWLVAVAWTAFASLACALRSGLADNDWSAFRGGGRRRECLRHECPRRECLPDTRGESFDWNTRTGAFAYMRIADDRERLLGGDALHNPGRGP